MKKRHRLQTATQKWQGERAINMDTYSPDSRALLPGRRLEAHGFKSIHSEACAIFPRCQSMKRTYTDAHLYPQFGDLNSTMFKQHHHSLGSNSKTKGLQGFFPVGFEPFLMRIFSDASITQARFPTPYCHWSETKFRKWFVKSMETIGIGLDFCHEKLERMKREGARQKSEWEAEKRQKTIEENVANVQEMLFHGTQELREANPVVVSGATRHAKSALERQIEADLKRIAEQRKMEREAFRRGISHELMAVSVEGHESTVKVPLKKRLKQGWNSLWT